MRDLIFRTLLLLCTLPNLSWAEDNLQAEELLLNQAQVQKPTTDKTQLVIQIKDQSFVLNTEHLSESDLFLFKGMPEADQEVFLEQRRRFVTAAAKFLTSTKWAIGFGVTSKDKISAMFKKNTGINADVQSFLRTQQVIQNLLNKIDRQTWTQAPVFARANEFSLNLSIGGTFVNSVGNKGMGGVFDIGLSLGYNRDSRALIFQIFSHREKFQSTLMPLITTATVTGKLGLASAYVPKAGSPLKRNGYSFYPPFVPGYYSNTGDSYTTGLSTGIGWPPPPMADVLTFTTSQKQDIHLRLSISPFQVGLIRVDGLVLAPIKKVFEWIYTLIPVKNKCHAIYRTA